MVNFIGVGAQRSATSWLYSCLYEHPAICAPQKEIHFFSRPRYEEKGIAWYEHIFLSRCKAGSICGEFSTSYLSHPEAAARIHKHYPDAKIIIVLREPAERAYSQYRLHGKVGWLDVEQVSFKDFLATDPSAVPQGRYAPLIKRYQALFPKEQIHIIVKDDIDTGPEKVLQDLFTFLGVDNTFTPTLLHRRINSGQQPTFLFVNHLMQTVSHWLYSHGFDSLVFTVKKTGIPAWLRKLNTRRSTKEQPFDWSEVKTLFTDDVIETSALLKRDLRTLWKY